MEATKENTMTTKEIKVSSIPTPDTWRKKDELLAQGFKHVNNISVRGSDRFTMVFTKHKTKN